MQPQHTEQSTPQEVINIPTILPITREVMEQIYTLKRDKESPPFMLTISYKDSPIKGTPFLTASINAGEKCKIDFTGITDEEHAGILFSWMKHLAILPFEELADEVAEIILYAVGYQGEDRPIQTGLTTSFIESFIQNHRDIVSRYITFIDSTILCLAASFSSKEDLEKSFQKIKQNTRIVVDRSFIGFNVYRLFKIKGYIEHHHATITPNTVVMWFEKQFEKPMFGENRLGALIAHENNTTLGIVDAFINRRAIFEIAEKED